MAIHPAQTTEIAVKLWFLSSLTSTPMPGERNWHFGLPTRSNGRAKQSRGIPGAGKMLRTQEHAPGGLVLSWEAALTPLSPSCPLYSGDTLSDVNDVAHTSMCPSKGTAAHRGRAHAAFPAKKKHQPGADALLLKCASLWHSRTGGAGAFGTAHSSSRRTGTAQIPLPRGNMDPGF